jgi:hypothetical protein
VKTFAYPDLLLEAPKLPSTMFVESTSCSRKAADEGIEIAHQRLQILEEKNSASVLQNNE